MEKDAQLLNMMVVNLKEVDNIFGLTARKQRHKLTFFKTGKVAQILGLPVQLCLIHRQCLLLSAVVILTMFIHNIESFF